MRFDVDFISNIDSNTLRFVLLPCVELHLHRSTCENVISFGVQFILWGITFTMQWYRNDYVEKLRNEDDRLQDRLDAETGIKI